MKDYFTTKQVADRYGVRVSTVSAWIKRGLPATRIGWRWMIPARVIEVLDHGTFYNGRNARPFNTSIILRAQRAVGDFTQFEKYKQEGKCPHCGESYGIPTGIPDVEGNLMLCLYCDNMAPQTKWGQGDDHERTDRDGAGGN